VTRRRPPADRRTLPPGEWERLLRERVYLRPIPVPAALHQIARARLVQHQDAETHNPKETNE